MIGFVVLALVFTVLTALTFILDGLLDSVIPDLGADGLISSTSVCAAVAGAGYGGWIGRGALDLGLAGALIVAGLSAVVVLGITGATMKVVRSGEVPQERLEDVVGRTGRALTGAPAGDPFEFLVSHRGQPLKISAVAEHDVSHGDQLVVTEVVSPTRLRVTGQSARP
ncbi:hypothetical protein [Nesterenkonia sp. K-15-9-6]|uniref:hypothetical protein n=1 Tax=Nesterenkonia sp. K-15-9-6 TaxID=3093918 RepID=UPI004044A362